MQTLESLNRKIKTAQDLLGVVKTMKSLAAVNIRQFERAVESLEQYRAVVNMGWTVFLRMGRPTVSPSRNQGDVCLVVGSDQGMCGQFNESLWPFLQKQATDQAIQGRKWIYWSLGEKVHGMLEDAGVPQKVHFSAPGSLNAVNERVQEAIGKVEEWRSAKKLENFYLCHHVIGEQGGYAPVFQKVLPLDASWVKDYGSTPWPNRCLPMLGSSREAMFAHLFRQYLFISFYRAFAQSLAGENAARLMAMQAAEKNIMELQDDLQTVFREQRQAGITSELLDIISGFEALKEEEGYTS